MLLRSRWGIAARSKRPTALLTAMYALALVLGGPVRAQDATTQLPPVVVEGFDDDTKAPRKKTSQGTDTRLTDVDGTLTTGAKGSGKSTTPGVSAPGDVSGPVPGGGGITGASTSIISREDIERSPQATLVDIISRAAGVQTTSFYGGVNGVGTTVDLRGFGVTGASNTLILINGRRQNDWDLPGFDLSTIAKESVERIEITRGNSGAVLYGDGAVGGVINIVTRNGQGAPNQARIEAGIGSFATKMETIFRRYFSPFSIRDRQQLHPALPDCPGHDNWKKMFKGSSGLFSFTLRDGYSKNALAAMLDGMDIFGMGASWGGYESLMIPAHPDQYRTAVPWPKGKQLLRVHIGLEDVEDLKTDLAEGFDRLNRAHNA